MPKIENAIINNIPYEDDVTIVTNFKLQIFKLINLGKTGSMELNIRIPWRKHEPWNYLSRFFEGNRNLELFIKILWRKQEPWNYLSGILEGNKNHGTIYQYSLKETGTMKLFIRKTWRKQEPWNYISGNLEENRNPETIYQDFLK